MSTGEDSRKSINPGQGHRQAPEPPARGVAPSHNSSRSSGAPEPPARGIPPEPPARSSDLSAPHSRKRHSYATGAPPEPPARSKATAEGQTLDRETPERPTLYMGLPERPTLNMEMERPTLNMEMERPTLNMEMERPTLNMGSASRQTLSDSVIDRPTLNMSVERPTLSLREFDRPTLNMGDLTDRPSLMPEQNQQNKGPIRKRLTEAEANSGLLELHNVTARVTYDDLKFVADLGHGSCGTVTKRTYMGLVMAVKTMPRNDNVVEMNRVLMDIDVIRRSLDCSDIVRCFGYFITPTDVSVCMECMATCLDRLLHHTNYKPFPETIIGKMMISTVNALHYLKSRHSIMHRDVKPSNILLDWNGAVKLCDFGIAGQLIESRAHSKNAGCPLYMGPERLDPAVSTSYDIRSDVWSVGMTMMELATGRYPYDGKSEFEMISAIIFGAPPRLDPENHSSDFCDVVDLCLQKDPTMRPRYPELLMHPFINLNSTLQTDVEEWFTECMVDVGKDFFFCHTLSLYC
ncbi:unnamed protein product [Caenorhabditis auriculariae]|uniref:mitogen-activated protein kinase kinase n=1 Tax=Caenorhabditis auriculariae TaxID=2777116 RepID=A0A8S1H1G2_9PELO|nr:unnamed protein product [Caenorhabditis auriculariae]